MKRRKSAPYPPLTFYCKVCTREIYTFPIIAHRRVRKITDHPAVSGEGDSS